MLWTFSGLSFNTIIWPMFPSFPFCSVFLRVCYECIQRQRMCSSGSDIIVYVMASHAVYYPSETPQRAMRGHGASPRSLSSHNPQSVPRDTAPGSVRCVALLSLSMIQCYLALQGVLKLLLTSSGVMMSVWLCPFSHYTLHWAELV